MRKWIMVQSSNCVGTSRKKQLVPRKKAVDPEMKSELSFAHISTLKIVI